MISTVNKNVFGLDISDRALRLVQFTKSGKKATLKSYNEVPIPEGIIVNGEIQSEEKLIKLLQQLVKSVKGKKINTRNVISVLPETKTFIKLIDVPTTDEKKISQIIKKEISNHIPLNPEEIYLDWQALKKTEDSTKVLIGAAPKRVADSYVSFLEKAGLIPYVLEIEAAAIIRSLIHKKDDKKPKIIIDFGAARTGLIIYDNETIQFTVSLPISGNKITEKIAKTLKLELKKAEKAKIVCGLDSKKCEGAMLKILLTSINLLTSQIKKSMVFYETNFPDSKPISQIILCGGGANFSYIDKVLSEKLNIPVIIGDPLVNTIQKKKNSIPKNKITSYTTAIGLALRICQRNNFL